MASYARFFSLFRQAQKAGVMHFYDHAELVLAETGERTASLRDLRPDELHELERKIEELMDPKQASMQRQRRKVIGILAGRGVLNAQGKPDMPHILAWVLRYGYLHKDLNAYTLAELPRLVTQAEAIVATDIQAIQRHK